MTNTALKEMAKELFAIKFEEMTGVKPSKKQITLLEADEQNEIPTYLLFATGFGTAHQHEWIWEAGKELKENK